MEGLAPSDLRVLLDALAEADLSGIREPEKLVALLLCGLMQMIPARFLRPATPQAENELSGVFGLTRREGEVLYWVARGKSNAEIGATLFIAPGTVKKHLDHIYSKLGVRTRTEAAVRAFGSLGGSAPPTLSSS